MNTKQNLVRLALVVGLVGIGPVAMAEAPEGWQFVDGVYTPIQETVTTYPLMNANETVYVGAGTNVTLSVAQSITNAKQGDTAKFVGATLTSTANLIVKGNDSKILFDGATVETTGTLEMNNSNKATGATEVLFVNGTTATIAKSVWWQSGTAPTAARLVVSNSTFTAAGNRADVRVGAAKTDAGSLCDFAIEIEKDGVMSSAGLTATGNANSHFLCVRQGGKYESTGTMTLSTASGVNSYLLCENGGRVEVTSGAFTLNAGAKLRFDLISPSTSSEALFSKMAGDYAAFSSGALCEIVVGKKASGAYKILEVMGNPSDAKRGVSGLEDLKANLTVTVYGSASCETRWETVGSGAKTVYELYATVKPKGFAIVIM